MGQQPEPPQQIRYAGPDRLSETTETDRLSNRLANLIIVEISDRQFGRLVLPTLAPMLRLDEHLLRLLLA